jgi:hypothetical protein
LTYAENNFEEWKERGNELLKEMVHEVDKMVIPIFESSTEEDSDVF